MITGTNASELQNGAHFNSCNDTKWLFKRAERDAGRSTRVIAHL